MYTYTSTYMYIYVYTCMYMYIRIYLHITYVYIYIYACIYMNMNLSKAQRRDHLIQLEKKITLQRYFIWNHKGMSSQITKVVRVTVRAIMLQPSTMKLQHNTMTVQHNTMKLQHMGSTMSGGLPEFSHHSSMKPYTFVRIYKHLCRYLFSYIIST